MTCCLIISLMAEKKGEKHPSLIPKFQTGVTGGDCSVSDALINPEKFLVS